MNSKLIIIVVVTSVMWSVQARADNIFDDSQPKAQPSRTRNEPPKAATAAPATQPGQASDELTDELNAKILELQKENAELKAKVKDLSDALAALEAKDSDKDKAKQEREQRIAAAKQRAENERLARIKAGILLSEAESLARTKAKITSSEIVHLQPRVGYFGPLDIRKEHCTLSFTKNGEPCEMSLVVMNGVITELTTH